MPRKEYVWLPREEHLDVGEIERLVAAFVSLGVDKVRITGGEPLLRQEVLRIIERVASFRELFDVGMTTNGVLLARHADALRDAGLGRVTISLDTLRSDRFARIAGADRLSRVVEGIEAAARAGLVPLKINTVVIRGYNDDELADILEFGSGLGAEVRFIEYMDVGGATSWSREHVVTGREILGRLERRYSGLQLLNDTAAASPATRYRLPNGSSFGVISSVTNPFCGSCDRSRVSADGTWFACLYADSGTDLRGPLREGASADDLASMIESEWRRRRAEGGRMRLAIRDRGPLCNDRDLRQDPRREMHTRGG